jgi:hypothetical protein
MVLHDFMFACSLYPTTKAFLQNVEKEVQYQLVSQHLSMCTSNQPWSHHSRTNKRDIACCAATIESALQHCALVWQQRK